MHLVLTRLIINFFQTIFYFLQLLFYNYFLLFFLVNHWLYTLSKFVKMLLVFTLFIDAQRVQRGIITIKCLFINDSIDVINEIFLTALSCWTQGQVWNPCSWRICLSLVQLISSWFSYTRPSWLCCFSHVIWFQNISWKNCWMMFHLFFKRIFSFLLLYFTELDIGFKVCKTIFLWNCIKYIIINIFFTIIITHWVSKCSLNSKFLEWIDILIFLSETFNYWIKWLTL